jgi:hypothetical protein
MTETTVSILLILAGIYLLIGIVFYFPFIRKGVHTFDDGVESAPLFMKILIFPGTVALWPILWKRWKKGGIS